jgi:hypothetical protein
MSKFVLATLVLGMTGFAVSAQAAGPAGDACAAKLNADGKAVYAATMAAKPTTETLRDTLEKEARSLVMGGKISRGSARENATAAGECAKVALE